MLILDQADGIGKNVSESCHKSCSASVSELTLSGQWKFLFHGCSKRIPVIGETKSTKLLGASSIIMSKR